MSPKLKESLLKSVEDHARRTGLPVTNVGAQNEGVLIDVVWSGIPTASGGVRDVTGKVYFTFESLQHGVLDLHTRVAMELQALTESARSEMLKQMIGGIR